MQVKPRSYPHPVLSHFGDDIVGSIFQPVVKVEVTKNAYQLSAVFKTNNDDLIQLVKSKKAFYAVHVECLQTRYREIFTTATDSLVFEVPSGQIGGRVEVCSFILAAQPIKSYRNTGFHDDYAKLSFTVRKGDTLAVGQDREFTAEKKSDPLRKVPSIFSIVPSDDPTATGMDIDASGPKVIVRLSRKNFDAYTKLRQSQPLHPVLSATVIVPALVTVLDDIRRAATANEIDAYAERRWFIVLSRKLRDMKIDPANPEGFVDSTLKIAHEILGQPLSASLEALMSTEEDTE